jgi:hypothetical protein
MRGRGFESYRSLTTFFWLVEGTYRFVGVASEDVVWPVMYSKESWIYVQR